MGSRRTISGPPRARASDATETLILGPVLCRCQVSRLSSGRVTAAELECSAHEPVENRAVVARGR